MGEFLEVGQETQFGELPEKEKEKDQSILSSHFIGLGKIVPRTEGAHQIWPWPAISGSIDFFLSQEGHASP